MKIRHGQIVRYFKPNDLTLFQLAILANEAHELHPQYSVLGRQCYFFASLIYSAAERHFGHRPSLRPNITPEETETVYIIDSYLSNKSGRWHGLQVNVVEEEDVTALITNYKVAEVSELNEVIDENTIFTTRILLLRFYRLQRNKVIGRINEAIS